MQPGLHAALFACGTLCMREALHAALIACGGQAMHAPCAHWMGSPFSWAGVRSNSCAAGSDSTSEKPQVCRLTYSLTRLGPVPSLGPLTTMLASLHLCWKGMLMSSCSSASDSRNRPA